MHTHTHTHTHTYIYIYTNKRNFTFPCLILYHIYGKCLIIIYNMQVDAIYEYINPIQSSSIQRAVFLLF